MSSCGGKASLRPWRAVGSELGTERPARSWCLSFLYFSLSFSRSLSSHHLLMRHYECYHYSSIINPPSRIHEPLTTFVVLENEFITYLCILSE